MYLTMYKELLPYIISKYCVFMTPFVAKKIESTVQLLELKLFDDVEFCRNAGMLACLLIENVLKLFSLVNQTTD